jgi:hypothetical protein
MVMIAMVLIQVPATLRKRDFRGLVAFGCLWVIATLYGALTLLDVPVLSPEEFITSFFSRLAVRLGL